MAVDSAHNVYVADALNNTIRKVTSSGAVTTLAGSAGNPGSADGTGGAARFYYPVGVALDTSGNLYVADYYNSTIRKVTSVGVVTTLAGSAGNPGSANGTGSAAQFNGPTGVAVDSAHNVFVTDSGNNTIRKVTSAGVVTTVGGTAGVTGTNDGVGAAAQFNLPTGVALDRAGNLYIGDLSNDRVTKGTLVNEGLASPVLTWTNPAAITYGSALGTNQLNATASVTGTNTYSPAAGTVLGAGTNTLSVVFTPTDRADYASVTGKVSLVVLPASLTVTASNAFRVYGQTNPAFSGTITGLQNADHITATYTTAATSNSPVGIYAITPTLVDPNGRLVNYTVTTNNGVLTVNKATPTITTMPIATAITYGQTLASSTLSGGVVSAPGNFAFTTPSTAPNTGTALQNVTFTPTDTTNYNTITTSVSVTVGQGTPVIVWPAPAPIAYGTGLGGLQLDASVNVPGSLLYTPAAGTVLSAGTNALTAAFTPLDTVDYSSATGAVSLAVSPAALTVTANDASRTYGATNPVFTVAYSGFVNGESLTNSDVAGAPLLTTLADTNSPVGAYAISNRLGSLTSTNYTFILTNGTHRLVQLAARMASSVSATARRAKFTAFCPGKVCGRPGKMPSNFPKAIKLPVNVIVPSNTSKPIAPISKGLSCIW